MLRQRACVLVMMMSIALAASSCGSIAGITQNDVEELEAGDCFDLDDLPAEIGRVQRKPCFGSNVAHVTGWVDIDESAYPDISWFNGVLVNWCNRFLDDEDFSFIASEVYVGWLYPSEETWGGGERQALCYYTAT